MKGTTMQTIKQMNNKFSKFCNEAQFFLFIYLLFNMSTNFCETMYNYSDNKIFLLKNSCKYFWSFGLL